MRRSLADICLYQLQLLLARKVEQAVPKRMSNKQPS